jgi:chorismate mutase
VRGLDDGGMGQMQALARDLDEARRRLVQLQAERDTLHAQVAEAARRDPVAADVQARWEAAQQRQLAALQEHAEQTFALSVRAQAAEAYAAGEG